MIYGTLFVTARPEAQHTGSPVSIHAVASRIVGIIPNGQYQANINFLGFEEMEDVTHEHVSKGSKRDRLVFHLAESSRT